MARSWRDKARSVIDPIYRECLKRGATLEEFNAALFEAYPFGERSNHPYAIWLDECKRWRSLYANSVNVSPGLVPKPRPLRKVAANADTVSALPGLEL